MKRVREWLVALIVYAVVVVAVLVVTAGLVEVFGLDAPTALGATVVVAAVGSYLVSKASRSACTNCGGKYRPENTWCPTCHHPVNRPPQQQ